jgi:hypothetical protein
MSEKYVVILRVGFIDGTKVNIPTAMWSEKKDAEADVREKVGKLSHMAEWELLRPKPMGTGRIPSGVQLKTALLQIIGIQDLGFDIGVVQCQDQAKPDIVVAAPLPENVSPLILKP